VLISNGQLQQNIYLREFLDKTELKLEKSKLNPQAKKKNDPLDFLIDKNKNNQKKLSASRLQSYLDCPRKYYFEYELKLKSADDVKNKVSSRELGNLEHKIIKDYYENNMEYVEARHVSFAQNQLESFLKENKKEISRIDLEVYKTEVVFNSGVGIRYLFHKKNEFSSFDVFFEKELKPNNYGITGQIDAYIKTENGVALIDFKRSKYGIGTASEVRNFEKIQLWIYSLIESIENIKWFSYLNLSDYETDEVMVKIESDELSNFKIFLHDLVSRFNLDREYLPDPKKANICTFCAVEKICSKGAL
jgi:CRISPR/Cas system-associated exonuclease Cas4 (RecB family)